MEKLAPDTKIHIKPMDVTDEIAARELFGEIKQGCGKADVLVNCAGIGNGGTLLGPLAVDLVWGDFVCRPLSSLQSPPPLLMRPPCRKSTSRDAYT